MNRETRGLIVVTALACVLAVVLLVRAPDDEPLAQPLNEEPFLAAALPTPSFVLRDGVRYDVAQVSPDAAEVAPTDDHMLNVYVFDNYSPQSPECSFFDSSAEVVAEDGTTVTLATFAYSISEQGEPVECALMTVDGKSSLYKVTQVRLDQPLGTRLVVDARSGHTVGPPTADQRS